MFVQEEISSGFGLVFNFLFASFGTVGLIYLWKSIYSTRGIVFGISQTEMIRYYLGVLIVGRLIKSGADDFFKEKISSGDITVDLIKPISYILVLMIRSIAKIIIYIFGLTIVAFFISKVMNITIIPDLNNFFLSIPTIFLAFLMGFFVIITFSSLYFFFPSLEHFSFLARDLVLGLLSGMMFNLELLTGSIYKVFNFLPFKYIINFPVIILTTEIDNSALIEGISLQLIWTTVLAAIAFYTFNAGRKRYSTYGG